MSDLARADRRFEDVVIYRAERTLNSVNGNPGYRFHTSAGVFKMGVDSALGYRVDNLVWSEHASRLGGPRVIGNPSEPRVTLLANINSHVWGFEYQGEVLL
jgi:hypothetical protein